MDLVLPACLVMRRLYVAQEKRDAYRQVVGLLAREVGAGLIRAELFADVREGFFVELHLFRDIAAWSAAREGADARISALLVERAGIVPPEHEEVTVHLLAPV